MPFVKPTLKPPSTTTEKRDDETVTCADAILMAGADEEVNNTVKPCEKDESSDSSDSDSDDDDGGAAATKVAAPKIVKEICAQGGADRDAAAAAADDEDDDDESLEGGGGGADDERQNSEPETAAALERDADAEGGGDVDETSEGGGGDNDDGEGGGDDDETSEGGGDEDETQLRLTATTPAATSAAPPAPPAKTSGASKGTTGKTKSKSKSREGPAPSEPKPPKTALACFRSTLKGDALKASAKTWSEMSDAGKADFERSAEIDKLRHRKEMIAHLSANSSFSSERNRKQAERFKQEDRDAAAGVVKPKAPVSSFMRFSADRSKEIRAEAPSLKFTEVGKLVGEEWRSLDASAKAAFEAAYKEDKQVYDEKKRAYDAAIEAFEGSSGACAKRSKKDVSGKSAPKVKDDESDGLSGNNQKKRPIRITYEDLTMQPEPAPARSAFDFFKEEARARLRAENELTRGEIVTAVEREWAALDEADTAKYEAMSTADQERNVQEQEQWQQRADLQLGAARKAACVRPAKREPEAKREPKLLINRARLGEALKGAGWISNTIHFNTTWFSPTMDEYQSMLQIVKDYEEQWRHDEATGILACITRA